MRRSLLRVPARAPQPQRRPDAGAVPVGEEAAAGPLRLTVEEVIVGQEAVDRILAAVPTNQPPREGLTYLLASVRARNAGNRPVLLASGDFALIDDVGGSDRFLGAAPPEPSLDGSLDPGAERTGWLAFAAPPDALAAPTLAFDSLTLPGSWADARLALGARPAPTARPERGEPNLAGTDPAAPAAPGEPVVTAEWRLELLDVLTGPDVFALVDYRTQALGENDAAGNDADGSAWVALRFQIEAVGGPDPAFLPANAFAVVDAAGEPIPDLLTLTPPRPDASGPYRPGAAREGWVAFDLPLALGATVVRFLPYATTQADPDPRFLAFG